ncbi:MAG TPA: hypothetical protein VI248_23365 [Kineosporiaceae bacterium]
MSQSLLPPHGVQSVTVPTLGAVPLGPDEPELFAHAMKRILEQLSVERRSGRAS